MQSTKRVKAKFGMQMSGTLDDYQDARNASASWYKKVSKIRNYDVDVVFENNPDLIFDDFKNRQIYEMIVVDPYYFSKNKNKIKSVSANYWSIALSKNNFIQYYLIAKKDLDFRDFKDNKNKILALRKLKYNFDAWIDKESYLSNKRSYKKSVKKVLYEKEESSALLQVIFNKADLAMISRKTWNTMVELNPGIEKKVKIVAKSKEIYLPVIGFFNKNIKKTKTDDFFNIALNLKDFPTNEQMRILFKFDHVFKLNKKELDDLELFYDEYEKLKLKYDNEKTI